MAIHKYQAFVKVAEMGSITKAAEAMGYTQSAVSRMVADLEDEWNLNLLRRSRGGLALSSDGLMLLRRADRLPKAWGYRLIVEPGEDVAALVGLYRDALNGRDVREDPAFLNMDTAHTTTGHYFRGVE